MIKGIVVFLLSLLLTTDVISLLIIFATEGCNEDSITVFIISLSITIFIGIFVWLWCNLNI